MDLLLWEEDFCCHSGIARLSSGSNTRKLLPLGNGRGPPWNVSRVLVGRYGSLRLIDHGTEQFRVHISAQFAQLCSVEDSSNP